MEKEEFSPIVKLALKHKKASIIVGSILILVIGLLLGSGIGYAGASKEIHGKSMTIDKIDKEIAKLKDDRKTQKSTNDAAYIAEQDKLNAFISENQGVYNLAGKKDELTTQVNEATTKLSDLKSEIESTQSQLDDINSQIADASGKLEKAKGAPKTLQAGKYTVGSDVPEGRYKATPVGSGSNFVVFGSGDETNVIVNTILGSNGEPSYTFECADGDVIQTEATVKLIPIK